MNLYTFPFGDAPGQTPDEPTRGGWETFAVSAPADRFLPFCLIRPRSEAFIDCVQIVDADDPSMVLRPSVPFPIGVYTKRRDAAYDYLTYSGAIIPGLSLPQGQPIRLEIDGYLSAPFVACPNLDNALVLRWQHGGPLAGVPYGTGLQQVLYLPGIQVTPLPAKLLRVSKKDELQRELISFATLTPQSTFTAVLVAPWLAQALEAAQLHSTVTVDGRPISPDSLAVKSEAEDAVRTSVTWTWDDPTPVVRTACAAESGPALVPTPEDYEPHSYKCGDETDTAPDWVNQGAPYCEQDDTAQWVPLGPAYCQQV